MGHLVGKDLYRKLGEKVDGPTTRAPWNEALFAILWVVRHVRPTVRR